MLTDYLDYQINPEEKERIEKHLEKCTKCREFSVNAKRVGNGLFAGSDRAEVPEYLWRRVRETILTGEEKKRSFADILLEKLKAILYIPKPAFAIATVVILLIALSTFTTIKINNRTVVNADLSGQTEYFNYLTDAVADNAISDKENFGTSIEKYFM